MLASSLFFVACDSPPEQVRPARQVDFPQVRFSTENLPTPSSNCPEGTLELEGKCISDTKAAKVFEDKSEEAREKLEETKGDPGAQVQAQQDTIKIQEKKVDKAKSDIKEIKKMIKKKKAAGKLPQVKDPFFLEEEQKTAPPEEL